MIDDFLVDVPVKINIWIRPDMQKRQFDVIKKAKPSILFIQSDGGRNDAEWEIIRQSRLMIEKEITWNCQVHKIYENENKGLYSMWRIANNYVWSKVDRCVGMEDDCIPSVSFFRFCKELLDKYENDERIFGISGYNPLGTCEDVSSDYFFSGESSSWSFATWKRVWLKVNENLDYIKDPYILKLMQMHLGKYTYARAVKGAIENQIDGHIVGLELRKGISRATENALYITPRRNMISNIGCDVNSIHSFQYNTLTSAEKKMYNSPVYEIDGPIKHPKYVIRDILYEKELRKRLAIGMPARKFYRRCAKTFLVIKFMGINGLILKLKKLAANRHET